ncbi:MAG: hypothetical protein KAX49_14100 [Halanaerobiales bacterium]|nr:hypothetical protein [Halanaerobiales bacterium]
MIVKEKMKGMLTDCVNGKQKEVELGYRIEEGEEYSVFHLIGGPTGYEDFRIERVDVYRMIQFGWTACMGTKNTYDRLYIRAEEMKKALGDYI